MGTKRIQSLVQKYKYVANLCIGLLGIIIVVVAAVFWKPDSTGIYLHFYNFGISIGCSMIATVLVAMILLALIPDEKAIAEELNEWGIIHIYRERKAIKIASKQFPKKNLDYIAFGLRHFRDGNPKKENIIKLINSGLVIRILTINPNSLYLKKFQMTENSGNLKSDIEELIKWVDDISAKVGKKGGQPKGSIELKIYDGLPLDFYCRSDDNIYVGPYMPGVVSGDVITYQYRGDSMGGRYYSDLFERIWSENTTVKMAKSYQDHFLLNQSLCIESVMKYFCGLMQEGNDTPVIGVVAIFKEDLRRTFFSCNKGHPEPHNTHQKDEGSVGTLLQLNLQGGKKNLYFSDYDNMRQFVYMQDGRHKYIKKSVNTTTKMESDDTVAVLAVPLRKGDQMIGVLTFDFAELPKRYSDKNERWNQIKDQEKLKGEEYALMQTYFAKAEDCGEILSNLLGHEMEIEYTRLYEEDWK